MSGSCHLDLILMPVLVYFCLYVSALCLYARSCILITIFGILGIQSIVFVADNSGWLC